MPVKSNILGPGSLKLGETASPIEFAAQLTKAALTPSVDSEDDIPVLSGDILAGDDTTTWELSGTVMQDYDLESLEDWCFENRSTVVPFQFEPDSTAGRRAWSGSVKVRPLTVGGDVKKRNTSDFTFPLVGEPTPVVVD
ncbi:hypothetical protein HQQ81_05640 [Microbacteriaceae bacterium VKM Ac-2854]|nr:hypothetical protein [Microbacteriaceae bacterium VKM Ac-2854]